MQMRAGMVVLGAAALLAGCNGGNEQGMVENYVRAQLAPGGNVTQVSMTRQGDGGYQGYATVRAADGHDIRVNCTLHRNGSGFQGMCGQEIDAQLIEATKATIRQQYTAQGLNVVEVEMARQDADHMAGHAIVRDSNGLEARVNCTSSRDPANGRFGLNCEQVGAASSPAQAQQEQASPDGDQAPADEGR